MAFKLFAPDQSFVQLLEPDAVTACAPATGLCLPLKTQFELAFQLTATVSGDDKDWFEVDIPVGDSILRNTVWGRICTECGDFTDTDFAHAFTFTGQWRKTITGDTDTWIGQFKANLNTAPFDALNTGDCFHLCFHKVLFVTSSPTIAITPDPPLLACTHTCFNKIADDCFTSHFTYRCNEDSFGFTYIDKLAEIDFVNGIRLPCYLRNLQLPSEEKSYTKSDGSKLKLFERIEEEYDLAIDFIPKDWHIKLKVLLAHDIIEIENVNETGGHYWPIVCNEKYEINWPEQPYGHAPAKTKIKRAEALSLINSNCK
jgi:hypothetical protein